MHQISMNPYSPDWPIEQTRFSLASEPLPRLKAPNWSNNHIELADQRLWMQIPGVAQFLIESGQHIKIFREPNISDSQLDQLLMATPFGAQILQRAELPLHAAGLVGDGGIYVMIAGDSGVGKSTTAAALAQLGWRIHNDDVCRVTGAENLEVHPGFQKVKLWPEACLLLGLKPEEMPLSLGLKDKRLFDTPTDKSVRRPTALIILKRESAATRNEVRKVDGFEAFEAIVRYTFRAELLEAMGCINSHFRMVSAFLRSVPVIELRARMDASPEAVAHCIEDCLAGRV